MSIIENVKRWFAPEVQSTEVIGGAKAITDIYDFTWPTVGYLNVNATMGLQHNHAAMVAMAVQWVGICSKFKAAQCADIPLRLYRKAGNARSVGRESRRVKGRKRNRYLHDMGAGGPGRKAAMFAEQAGDIEEVFDSPILDLLHAPNSWDGPGAYMRRLFQALSLTGNAYDLLCSDGGMQMLPLLPQWTRVKPDKEMIVSGYRYGRVQGLTTDYDAEDVVHHKQFPAPDNVFYGVGDLHDVMSESHVFAFAMQYELYQMQNGIRPGDLAIKAKAGTTGAQVDMIRAELRKRYQGPRQSGTPMIFVDAEPVPLMRTAKDMEYQEGMKRIMQQTFAAFGVPEDLITRKEGAIQIGGGGAKSDAMSVFMRTTVQPTIRLVCETWNSILLPRLGYDAGDVWLAYDNPCEDDERATDLSTFTNAGIMSINEARAEIGFEPTDDGDELRYNGTPLSKVGQLGMLSPFGGGGSRFGDAPIDDDGADDSPKEPRDGKEPPALDDDGEKHHHPKVDRTRAMMWRKSAGDVPQGDDVLPVDASIEARLYRALRRFFGGAAPKLMQSLDPSFGLRIRLDGDAEIVASWFEQTTAPLAELVVSGWNTGLAQLPSLGATQPINAIAGNAAMFLREYQGKLLRSVSDTVDERVRNAIADGIERGATITERITATKEVLGPGTEIMAENITRTESANAFTAGAIEAWKESDIVEGVRWLASGNPCVFCSAMEGRTVPLGTPFFRLGESLTAGGKTMVFDYRQIDGPGLHPQCRCGLNSVLKPIGGDQ